MAMAHQNDPDLIRRLLFDPGVWAVVGLSANRERDAWKVSRWLEVEHGKVIIPIHPRAETVHGAKGYPSLSDLPDGTDLKVVECFVNSSRVGKIVDEAIANKDRLDIDAIWMQKGVVDAAAAERARRAGIGVVMDTCPRIEFPRIAPGN